jgi:TPR repeat protein
LADHEPEAVIADKGYDKKAFVEEVESRGAEAVTVGVDRYPGLFPPRDLSRAEADARAVGDTFREVFGYEVVPLLGKQATRDGILRTLREVGSGLGERDALIVYFAGHGQVVDRPGAGEAGFLVPADAELDLDNHSDFDRWRAQAVDMQGVVDLLNGLPAGHVLLIADSCCSGFLTSRGALADWDLKNFLFRRSRTVLSATTRHQAAADGRFTAKLIAELRRLDAPDKRPTAASVYDVFYPLLKEVSAESKGGMTPQLAQVDSGDGMFVFIPASVPRAEIERDLRALEVGEGGGDGAALVAVAQRRIARTKQATTLADVAAALEAIDYRFAADAQDRQAEWEGRFERFARNAAAGDAFAMAALHFCYSKGLGTDRDPEKAYEWARRADRVAGQKGLGRFLLGRCYEHGLGVRVSGPGALDQARALYRESAATGSPFGQYAVSARELPAATDADEARRLRGELAKAVAAGVGAGEVDLAADHGRSRPGLPADKAEQRKLLERAAARGNPAARLALFRALATADASPADLKLAEAELRQSATAGHPPAMSELGYALLDGPKHRLKLRTDAEAAFGWFDRAAQAGDDRGLVRSALMLADGKGTRADQRLARERLEAAVKLGSADADFVQGDWYRTGKVYKQSHREALAAFRRSADKGHLAGCAYTGLMYSEAQGFEVRRRWKETPYFHRDWYLALHYFQRAYDRGLAEDPACDELAVEVTGVVNTFMAALAGNQLRFERPPGTADVPFFAMQEAARTIAEDWREREPGTFGSFCKLVGLDPKTLGSAKKKP